MIPFVNLKEEYQFLAEELNLKINSILENGFFILGDEVRKFEEEKHGDPIFFQIDTQYPMKAVIANILFEKHPNNTIFVYREYEGVYKISGRSNKVDLGEVMKKASAGIGQGGGHPKAAAASVKDFELFRERVLELV